MTASSDPRGTLRVAAAQAASVPGDVAANVDTAVSLVEAAAADGARVAVLPELFLTGYDAAVWTPHHVIDVDDERLAPLQEVASTRSVVVVASAAVRRSTDRTTLSVVVVGADGAVTAPYDKQHLFSDERAFFSPGDHGASIVVDGWELGLGVCYDGCFPEHARAAAADGATAYLVPAAYVVGSEHRRDLYYPVRALENGFYVVFSGLVGQCGEAEFSGGSAVYDPEGTALARAGSGPGIACADLDPTEVLRVRARHRFAADRLPDLGFRSRVTLDA